MTSKRIKKDFQELNYNPISGIIVELINDDIFHWKGTIKGPEGSPYEGGVFFINVKFPAEYPFKPPHVKFTTPIYHPNVEKEGLICMDIINNGWTPASTSSSILKKVYSLMCAPNPDNPVNPDAASVYITNREKFNQTAKEWTQKHAI